MDHVHRHNLHSRPRANRPAPPNPPAEPHDITLVGVQNTSVQKKSAELAAAGCHPLAKPPSRTLEKSRSILVEPASAGGQSGETRPIHGHLHRQMQLPPKKTKVVPHTPARHTHPQRRLHASSPPINESNSSPDDNRCPTNLLL